MGRYLAFTVHAPLAAFGAVAVGERRPGWDRPARSALIGLVAASLGLDRADEAAHLALDAGYGIAVRTDAPGRVLADYHTAQVPPARRGRRYATRAAELADRPLETVLTRREYRTDALHLVAIWERPGAPHALEFIADALHAPGFVLYAGRKSCPLGLPLGPVLLEAANPAEALAAREAVAPPPERELRHLLRARPGTIASDPEGTEGLDVQRIERRRDRVVSRVRWQFALRDEAILRRIEGEAS